MYLFLVSLDIDVLSLYNQNQKMCFIFIEKLCS